MSESSSIYIKLSSTNPKHRIIINQHQVWDRELFIVSQIKQYNNSKTKPDDRRVVEVVEEEEYRAWRRLNK